MNGGLDFMVTAAYAVEYFPGWKNMDSRQRRVYSEHHQNATKVN
jgi:hypothetical protein